MSEEKSRVNPYGDWTDGELKRLEYSDKVVNGFCDGDASKFDVRNATYLTDKTKSKQPSAIAAFVNCGVNVYKTDVPLADVAKNVPTARNYMAQHEDGFFFLVNWRIPVSGGVYHSVVHMFRRALPVGEDKAFDNALQRFLDGDHAYKKSHFKFICQIVTGPWAATFAINQLGGSRPAILGNKLNTRHFQGKNYIEIDIEVASSKIAASLSSLILRSTSSMCVDLAFLIESQVDDELPERVLGVTRFGQCDISALGIEIGLPESYDDDAEQDHPSASGIR